VKGIECAMKGVRYDRRVGSSEELAGSERQLKPIYGFSVKIKVEVVKDRCFVLEGW
jgi:hypothetical protein